MTHDPVVAETVRERDSLEPRFVLADQEQRAGSVLERYRGPESRRPNILFILFDDVGWGDFGCYGGGVAVGAPTPNIDRLARRGMLLTSCYSEPSCTPSRASIMTGRLPMRHGLLRPPMYGQPGGLDGEVTLAQLLSDSGYVTQAVGKWHIGENVESQPQNVGFDDFYGFLSVSDMYTEWRDPNFFPEIVYSEERTALGGEPALQQVLRPRRPRRARSRTWRRSRSRSSHSWTTSGPAYSFDFIRRMAEPDGPTANPGSSTTAPGAPTSTTTPTSGSWARLRPSTPTRTPSSSSTTSSARLVAELEATGPDGRHADLRVLGQRSRDGDLARRRLFALPQRQGLHLGGRSAGPGHRHLAGHDRRRPGRPTDCSRRWTCSTPCLTLAGTSGSVPEDRYIDGVDQTSFLLDPHGVSNRKYLYYWLTNVFSALRVGEWKFMVASTSDDDRDCFNLGGFTGVTQKYSHGRLYNLYLDPKESHSYMIRKLAYIDSFTSGIANTSCPSGSTRRGSRSRR